jgi:hypothetical protein
MLHQKQQPAPLVGASVRVGAGAGTDVCCGRGGGAADGGAWGGSGAGVGLSDKNMLARITRTLALPD